VSSNSQLAPDQDNDSVPLLKKYIVHTAFLSLIIGVAWQGRTSAVTDRNSLLYSVIAGEEVVEGPLDPTAYAGTDTPGVGGARLSALDASLGIELITFDDPEVTFASTLGGNAVIAPLSPLAPEPGSEPTRQPDKPRIYTVREGDTVASVAAEFNISTNTILWANGLTARDIIKVGDNLTILPTTGVLHTVDSGETVLALASKYDANTDDIINYNQLGDDAKLYIGQKIIIPDGYISPPLTPSRIVSNTAPEDSDIPSPAPAGEAGFIWPTTSRHIAQYFRWGHTGIDIDNQVRPPVYAAAAGTVEFTGRLGAYGNLAIVNHGGGLTTYYAHLDKFYVSPGQSVAKGDAIAKMGSTGRSTGPHLHFEVRRSGQPVNPLSMY